MSDYADDLNDGLDYEFGGSSNEAYDELSGEESTEIVAENVKPEEETTEEKVSNNNQKRKKKDEKLVNKKKQKMEYDVEQKLLISKQSNDRISDFFATKIRMLNPDLSSLELSELYIPKTSIKYTGFWDKERNLSNLQNFIEYNFKKLITAAPTDKKKNKTDAKKNEKAANEEETLRKFILILSSSNLRACDVHRATKDIANSSLKLIKKNKLKDDLQKLKTTRSRILASTTNRIVKILKDENSTLKVSEIKIILIDSTYLDSKKRHIFDYEELLNNLKFLITGNNAKIYLY